MCACVIPQSSTTLTLEEMCRFLLEKGVAKFKLPERLELVEDFPLTRIGKVSKSLLVERAQVSLKQENVMRSLERKENTGKIGIIGAALPLAST
jgi:2,3-dihydroxybenzoate-AMP ligase